MSADAHHGAVEGAPTQPNTGSIAGEAGGRPSCSQQRRQNRRPSSACFCLMDPALAPWRRGLRPSSSTLHSVMSPTTPLAHCTCGSSLTPSYPQPDIFLRHSCDACSSQPSRPGLRPNVDARVTDDDDIQQWTTSSPHFSGRLGSIVHNCEEYPFASGNMGSGPIGILAMSPTHHFTTDYGIPVSDVDDIIYSRTGFPMESGIPLRTCEQYRISQSPQSEPSLRRPPHEDPGLRPSSQSNSRREYAKPLRPRRLHGPQASRSESRSGRSPDSAYGSFVPTGPSTPASYVSDPVDKIATLLPRCESISASELLERCLQLGDGLQTHTASFSCGAENETCPSREIPAWDWAFNSLDDHAGVPGSHSCPASQSASLDYRTIGHEEELVREPRSVSI